MLTLLGQQLFPSNYAWNQNIANAPVAANSAAIIAHIGTSVKVHPDWGADDPANGNSPLYGIPYNVVHGNSTATVNVTIDNYPDESDIVPVPIPSGAVIEGDYQNGPNANGNQTSDSHLIVWDEDNHIAYELYGVTRPTDAYLFESSVPHTDGKWHAAQETVWNMNTDEFRTLGYTSADAAGLSILAGLVRPDEGLTVAQGGQGTIDHALRFTLPKGDVNPQYIYPGSHMVNETQGADNLPLGARLRLANTQAVNTLIDNMPPESQIIARAMQQYGLILADIGSAMYVTGASGSPDANDNLDQTWDQNDIFASNGLEKLTAGDFEVVDLTPIVTGLSASSGPSGTTLDVFGQNFSGAAGYVTVFFGNIPVMPVNVTSDTEISVTVPAGLGTVDVTVQSGQNEADNNSGNPNANVNAPIFGYGTSAKTAADQFTLTGPEIWSNGAGTGKWTDAGNWNLDTVPSANVDVVFASAGLSNGATVNLNGSQAARSLTIESSASYTLGGSGSLALGTGAITRANSSSGTQTIAQPVVLDANGVWDIAGSGELVVSNTVSGAFSLQKADTGKLLLSGNNSYSQGTIVTGGTLIAGSPGAILSGTNLMVGSNVLSYFGLPVPDLAGAAVAAIPDEKKVAASTAAVQSLAVDVPDPTGALNAPRIERFTNSLPTKIIPSAMAILRPAGGADDLDKDRAREMRTLALDAAFARYGS